MLIVQARIHPMALKQPQLPMLQLVLMRKALQAFLVSHEEGLTHCLHCRVDFLYEAVLTIWVAAFP